MKSLLFLGTLFVALTMVLLQPATLGALQKVETSPVWEYKTIRIDAIGGSYSRLGSNYSSVGSEATSIPESTLLFDMQGAAGWEMVSSNLEMETAFPNFARGNTVEGLKSNVRPQSLVVLFKRQTTKEKIEAKIKAELVAAEARLKADLIAAEARLKAQLADAEARKASGSSTSTQTPPSTGAAASVVASTKNAEIWEAKKDTAILDGVVPDLESTGVKVLAVGPKSRLIAGCIIEGIQTTKSSEMIPVSSWAQVKELLKGIDSGEVRISWRGVASTYVFSLTITYPVKQV